MERLGKLYWDWISSMGKCFNLNFPHFQECSHFKSLLQSNLEKILQAFEGMEERGVMICSDASESQLVKGSITQVSIPMSCRSGTKGHFHSHSFQNQFSDGDLVAGIMENLEMECIGYHDNQGKSIKCYSPSKIASEHPQLVEQIKNAICRYGDEVMHRAKHLLDEYRSIMKECSFRIRDGEII